MAEATLQGIEVRIHYPDGKQEKLLIDSDRVLIGSGAHCEVRLPAEQSAVEHVVINMAHGGGGLHAEARALDRLPTLGGIEFSQTPVPEGTPIGIGRIQIFLAVAAIDANANVVKKKTQQTSPITYVLAILAIPLAAYVLLMDEDTAATAKMPKEVPKLFTDKAARCPHDSEDQALAFAAERRMMAEGKRERRPFKIADGIQAVPLFEMASACFKVAGSTENSLDMATAAEELRKQVELDYRAHQVRLEHALSVNDLDTAQKEIRVLKHFTEGRSGEYVIWLGNVDRQIQLKLAQKKS